MIRRAFGPSDRYIARRIAFGTLGASVLVLALAGWMMGRERAELAELKDGVKGRQTRLAADRRAAVTPPNGPKPAALDRSRAVSRLRTALTGRKGCTVEEFQASTEEAPYLTVYSTEGDKPGWMQVPVRVVLKGRAPALTAAVATLREIDVPFEVDTVEVTRQSTDNTGMSTVSAQIGLRVLVYRGEG